MVLIYYFYFEDLLVLFFQYQNVFVSVFVMQTMLQFLIFNKIWFLEFLSLASVCFCFEHFLFCEQY